MRKKHGGAYRPFFNSIINALKPLDGTRNEIIHSRWTGRGTRILRNGSNIPRNMDVRISMVLKPVFKRPFMRSLIRNDRAAISLDHPVGTSGNRIVLHLVNAMRRLGKKRGVATEYIGGGQGGAILIETM
jgi:Thiolase, C-terminal domain